MGRGKDAGPETGRKTMTNQLIATAKDFADFYEGEWIPAHDELCPDDCTKIDTAELIETARDVYLIRSEAGEFEGVELRFYNYQHGITLTINTRLECVIASRGGEVAAVPFSSDICQSVNSYLP